MKKRIAVFMALCGMLAAYTCAYAADAEFDRTSGKVTISGNAEANEYISVVVLKNGISADSIKNALELKDKAQLFYEFSVPDNGKYEETLNLGDESGVYTILLNGSSVRETLSAETFSTQEIADYLKKLTDAAANNTVKTALREKRLRDVLGLNELYDNEEMRDELADLLTKKKEFNDIADVESVRKPMQDRIDCLKEINAMVNKAQVKELLKKTYALLETSDSSYVKYLQMTNTDAVDKAVFDAKPYGSLTEVTVKLRSAVDAADTVKKPATGGGGGETSSGGKGSYVPGNAVKNETNNTVTDNSLFKDVTGSHWAKESVESLAKKGIVNGKMDDMFCPDEPIKREEFVKLIVGAAGLELSGENDSFTDTDKSEWYSKYLFAAHNAGLITGREDGSFGIGETLTRQDMAAMVYRVLSKNSQSAEVTYKPDFEDYDSISEYARESVAALSQLGIINGMDNNRFAPSATATRAQAAQIICKLMKLEGSL